MLVKDSLAFFFFMLPGFVLKSKLEYQESWWCSSSLSLKAENQKTQWFKLQSKSWQGWSPRETSSSVQPKSRKRPSSTTVYSGRRSSFSFSLFIWLDEPHPQQGGQSAYSFYQFILNLIQKDPHRHIQNNVCPNVWTLCDPDKVTH
jgi:hypothetical protein